MNEEPLVTVKYDEPALTSQQESVVLENIVGKLPMVTAVPTLIPRTFGQGLALDTTSNTLYYYDFTNNAWKVITTARRNVISITTASAYAINTDVYNALSITALAGAINSISASGSPNNFDSLIVRIKDDGTARAITWDATKFVSRGVTLPATTVISKVTTVGFLYNSVAAIWDCVALAQE